MAESFWGADINQGDKEMTLIHKEHLALQLQSCVDMEKQQTACATSNSLTVTVIITVFKRTEYLRQALQSALDQIFNLYEIIVTDDSCSPMIRDIVESFDSSRIHYRCNSSTLGVALNLRAAINEACGQYIAILNDDDVWEPEFLSELVKPLEEDETCILSFSDHWIIGESGEFEIQKSDDNSKWYGRNTLPEGSVFDAKDFVLRRNGVPLAMASVFRKDAIDWELLVKEVSGAYDFWISCLMVSTGRPIYYINKRLTRYRVHGAMETVRRAPDKNENMVFIYNRLIKMGFFPDKKTLLLNRYSQALFQVGKDNLYFNRCEIARAYFLKSLKIKKTIKACVGLGISYLSDKIRKTYKLTKS